MIRVLAVDMATRDIAGIWKTRSMDAAVDAWRTANPSRIIAVDNPAEGLRIVTAVLADNAEHCIQFCMAVG